MGQLKQKINYHLDKYMEVRAWNRDQPIGITMDCDFLISLTVFFVQEI